MADLRIQALFLAALLASAHGASVPSFFRRDEVCGGESSDKLSQCGKGLDDGLCCSADESCISLAGGSSVLCCPDGSSCNRLKTVSCDITRQDPEQHPTALLKTLALGGELPKCGDRCCPFGFSCNDDGECDMNENQASRPSERPESDLPSSTVPTSSGSPVTPSIIPTSSDASESSTSASASATPSIPAEEQIDYDDDDTESNGSGLSTGIIVVSVLGGILLLVALVIGLVMFISRRKRRNNNLPPGASEKTASGHGFYRRDTPSSSFGNIISDPIPQDHSALRTDFALRSQGTSTKSGISDRVSSMHSRDSTRPLQSQHAVQMSSPPRANTGLGLAVSTKGPPRVPTRTLSNATMTTVDQSNHLQIPPIRTMRNQQKPVIRTETASSRDAVPRVAITDATTPTEPTGPPMTPPSRRENSSECINVFADPGTVGSEDGRKAPKKMGLRPEAAGGLQPPKMKRNTSGTTFTELMDEAELGDVRRGNPYVPYTPGRSLV